MAPFPMINETIIGVLLGIPPGILGGIYAGLIVARYQRFADLRSELLRIIRSIDFMDDNGRVQITESKDISDILHIAGDFAFLRHKYAFETASALNSAISSTHYQAMSGGLSFDQYSEHYKRWQQQARSISPNLLVLLRLWSGL